MAIPAAEWKAKDAEISTIKARYGLQTAEIHTAWLLRKYTEQVKIVNFSALRWEERKKEVGTLRNSLLNHLDLTGDNKKKKAMLKFYKETQSYVHLTLEERKQCIKDLCECIKSWTTARIFFHAIKKEKFDDSLSNVGGIYEDAFCQVITRFQSFLSHFNAGGYYGLLVSDNNDSINKRLTTLTRHFHQRGAFWREIPNIVETPLFVDSQQTCMVQLADIIAYTIRRYFDASEEENFFLIKERVDRYKGGLVGGRHLTPLETCHCSVCRSARSSRR